MMERSVINSRLLVGILSVVVASLGSSEAAAEGYGPFLEVSKTDAGFTVEAEDATLLQVLAALGEKAGFSVQDSGADRPPIPVFEVRDATLEAMLRQLLGSSNHLIVYRGGRQGKIEEGSIDKIVLLSPGKRERAVGRPVSSLAGPGAVPRPAPKRPNPNTGELPAERALEKDATPAYEPDPNERLRYGAELEAMERRMVEQLDVDPDEVAAGEPGVPPSLPPGLLQKLEAAGYGDGSEAIPPPEVVSPAGSR